MASQLLINEPPLQVLPTLAQLIGLNEAIVLQQVHYWLNPQFNKNLFDGRYWVHNTYGQWQKQFPFFSERTLRRTVKNLELQHFLMSCKGGELNQVKFYTIDYALLQTLDLTATRVLPERTTPQGQREEEGPPKPGGQRAGLANSRNYPSGESRWPDERQQGPQASLNPSQANVIYPTWPKWPGHPANLAAQSGQSGQVLWPTWPAPLVKLTTPSGQFGRPSYTETTAREYTENTLLPPLPFSTLCCEQGNSGDETGDQEADGKEIAIGRTTDPFKSKESQAQKNEEDEQMHLEAFHKTAVEGASNQELLVFQEMVAIWNRVVQDRMRPGQKAVLTNLRQIRLQEFLATVFAEKPERLQLGAWEEYCTLISKSRFLAGENNTGFKVTLDWALVPQNAWKVLEGAIYDKPEPVKAEAKFLPWEEFEEELARTLPSGPHLLAWVKIGLTLAKVMGQIKFRSWFWQVSLMELTETTAIFTLENGFVRDYIVNHFSSELRCAVEAFFPSVKSIELKVVSPEGGAR